MGRKTPTYPPTPTLPCGQCLQAAGPARFSMPTLGNGSSVDIQNIILIVLATLIPRGKVLFRLVVSWLNKFRSTRDPAFVSYNFIAILPVNLPLDKVWDKPGLKHPKRWRRPLLLGLARSWRVMMYLNPRLEKDKVVQKESNKSAYNSTRTPMCVCMYVYTEYLTSVFISWSSFSFIYIYIYVYVYMYICI